MDDLEKEIQFEKEVQLRIGAVMNGRDVRRYYTANVLSQQTIGHHSHGVAMWASMMALDDPAGLSVPLLMACLTHDLAEATLGDIPSPAKRAVEPKVPGFRALYAELEAEVLSAARLDWEDKLSPKEQRWLKLADCYDGLVFCLREAQMGNRLVEPVYHNFRSYIGALLKPTHECADEEPMVAEMVAFIDNAWRNR